jgi:peptide/nickel transport system ATP-binding protein
VSAAADPGAPVLDLAELRVAIAGGGPPVVEDVALQVFRGQALGIVGESGSGKSTVAQALLGFARPGLEIVSGSLVVANQEMLGVSERVKRGARGRLISYVPQDPGTSLNPSVRIGDQISEVLTVHGRGAGEASVASLLERVHLPGERSFQRRFPHQLSGGQQQRLAIAVAVACEPAVLVLDEPTTGLDVITQARILDEVSRLQRESAIGLVYVSHDLAVVASVADEIAVMYAGEIVERGPSAAVIANPRHPYTLGLVSSVPDHVEPRRLEGIPGVAVGVGNRPPGCSFAPRCPQRVVACEAAPPPLLDAGDRLVRCIRWELTPAPRTTLRGDLAARAIEAPLLEVEELRAEHRSRDGAVVAAERVSFSVAAGECVALVGESGSGKTTIARCLVGLHERTGGRMTFAGEPLAPLARDRSRAARRGIQIVFQNPLDSLNPRRTVRDAVTWPARSLRGMSAATADAAVATLLERVRLPERTADRYPGELSGGERQRVAIARALAAGPTLLLCDEVTSALDVSVQAAVLDLLAELRRELDLAVLFITHNLGVVASIAERVLVLDRGVVCETGVVDQVLRTPSSDYTARLLAAAPSLVADAPAPSSSEPR